MLTACGIETGWSSIGTFKKVYVATVLTACGIETSIASSEWCQIYTLQQCLPLAVLKHVRTIVSKFLNVDSCNSAYRLRYWNGLSSDKLSGGLSPGCNSAYRLRYWNLIFSLEDLRMSSMVATVLTACGIETILNSHDVDTTDQLLQQCLPLAVLKRPSIFLQGVVLPTRCNSAYRLRYWNKSGAMISHSTSQSRCNSAYRLRYWNAMFFFNNFILESVATVLTACGIET